MFICFSDFLKTDYFIEDELIKKIGLPKYYWNDVIMKELIDNALVMLDLRHVLKHPRKIQVLYHQRTIIFCTALLMRFLMLL